MNEQQIGNLLKRMLEAFERAGIRPSHELGDACLMNAAVMHEKLGRSAFMERAALLWAMMIEAGDPTPEDGEELAAMLTPTTRERLEDLSRQVAASIAAQCPPGIGFALLLFNLGEAATSPGSRTRSAAT
jgi:hypothetical protein